MNFTVISPKRLIRKFLLVTFCGNWQAFHSSSRKGLTEALAMLRTERDKVVSYFPSDL